MKKAVFQHLLDDEASSGYGNPVPIVPGGFERLDIADLYARDALHHQDTPSGKIPVDLGNIQMRFTGKVVTEAVGVAPLAAVIQFRF